MAADIYFLQDSEMTKDNIIALRNIHVLISDADHQTTHTTLHTYYALANQRVSAKTASVKMNIPIHKVQLSLNDCT